MTDLFDLDRGAMLVAGVDEAGRGPLAGDVVAAAVILPVRHGIKGINDSKKLSAKRRESLFIDICERSLAWSVGRCNVAEIDTLNILHASMLAMKRAVDALQIAPDLVLVDGNRLPVWSYRAEAIIGGDAKEACIGAASIVAKVTRDREMLAYAREYPDYGFDKHKGYPTQLHMQKLREHGVTAIHRRSFAPVQRVLAQVRD